jgi:hypothetical protein
MRLLFVCCGAPLTAAHVARAAPPFSLGHGDAYPSRCQTSALSVPTSPLASPGEDTAPRCLGRYEIRGELGRGGMAVVYRVRDPLSARELALKQLLVQPDARLFAESSARFEREFRTLSELSHPRIIEVYDYALDAAGPFYSMEMLDGGDVLERAPLPWREACVLLHDVCSSLALLHSRRLVHCDVTPGNVRCTKDGRAKLIDFGAMVPMGRGTMIVGTPAFTAPEVVARSDLDARTDLYSLGATLYYALTGRVAFAARNFSELVDAWLVKPRPPSHFAPGVPEAVDRLALSLLSLDAGERPRNAFEVMQRLAAIADIPARETLDVSHAYLSAPVMVGRETLMAAIGQQLEQALSGQASALIVSGSAGLGRSRVLDASVIAAKLRGACVLRASADAARGVDFAVAQTLCEQLLEGLPEAALAAAEAEKLSSSLFEPHAESSGPRRAGPQLRDLTAAGQHRATLQDALVRWLLAVSREHAIAIALDDLQRSDEASAALLAQCAAQSGEQRLILLLTIERDAPTDAGHALEVLSRQARSFELAQLSELETIALLSSVFGDVPNLATVARAVHAAAGGNPRLSLELSRHLVDSGCVRYADGSWTLPNRLGPADLPEGADSALRARVAALSPQARQLLEAQVLASHEAFTRADYALLAPGVSAGQVDQAVLELVAREFLVSDGRVYWLAHRSWAGALTAHMSEAQQRERHAALAGLYGDGLKSVFHMFAAGWRQRGLDLLVEQLRALGTGLHVFEALHIPAWEMARLLECALDAARELGRSPRVIYDLQCRLTSFAVASEDAHYWNNAPAWLESLRRDSGLALWEQLAQVGDPGARLTQALQTAFERYTNTPEAERVCRPDEAIRDLVHFVAISIAIGSRSLDVGLLHSLPGLLEPFAPLSPAVSAIHQNACASREFRCLVQPEKARLRWLEVHEKLAKQSDAEVPYVALIRSAIAATIGVTEAQLGLRSAERWAELVEADPMQTVHALYLRKVVCLQQGDWAAAEQFRKRAENLSLQSRVRPMFASTLLVELSAHAQASDLTGVKQVKDRIDVLAAQSRHWRGGQLLAEGVYKRLCGQLEAACELFDTCVRECEPDPQHPARVPLFWPPAVAGQVETLVQLGRSERARTLGTHALERCRERGIEASAQELVCALALAEAKLGEFESAVARLHELIQRQLSIGATGLVLGASYEARARVAIWARDEDALAEYGRLTAQQYRRGAGSPLGARYEQLMDEARVTFPHRMSEFAEFDLASVGGTRSGHTSVAKLVTQVLRQATTPEERATFALSLLCEDRGALGGHLYLVEEQGIALAATQTAAPAAPELAQLAQDWLTRELEESEQATQFAADLPALPISLHPGSSAVSNDTFEPVMLTCIRQGRLHYIGVALLLLECKPGRVRSDARLTTAIADQLFEAGDVRGQAV